MVGGSQFLNKGAINCIVPLPLSILELSPAPELLLNIVLGNNLP